jgi:hypothetical protein
MTLWLFDTGSGETDRKEVSRAVGAMGDFTLRTFSWHTG